jgi:hypothetical protein
MAVIDLGRIELLSTDGALPRPPRQKHRKHREPCTQTQHARPSSNPGASRYQAQYITCPWS